MCLGSVYARMCTAGKCVCACVWRVGKACVCVCCVGSVSVRAHSGEVCMWKAMRASMHVHSKGLSVCSREGHVGGACASPPLHLCLGISGAGSAPHVGTCTEPASVPGPAGRPRGLVRSLPGSSGKGFEGFYRPAAGGNTAQQTAGLATPDPQGKCRPGINSHRPLGARSWQGFLHRVLSPGPLSVAPGPGPRATSCGQHSCCPWGGRVTLPSRLMQLVSRRDPAGAFLLQVRSVHVPGHPPVPCPAAGTSLQAAGLCLVYGCEFPGHKTAGR